MSRPANLTSDDQAIAEAELASAGAVNGNRRVDVEIARAYNEYLRDWRWNMATHINLQREYMGRRAPIRNENLF
jgi:hypothetical protein